MYHTASYHLHEDRTIRVEFDRRSIGLPIDVRLGDIGEFRLSLSEEAAEKLQMGLARALMAMEKEKGNGEG